MTFIYARSQVSPARQSGSDYLYRSGPMDRDLPAPRLSFAEIAGVRGRPSRPPALARKSKRPWRLNEDPAGIAGEHLVTRLAGRVARLDPIVGLQQRELVNNVEYTCEVGFDILW